MNNTKESPSSDQVPPYCTPLRRPRKKSISSLQGMKLSDLQGVDDEPRSTSDSAMLSSQEMTGRDPSKDNIEALCTPSRRPRSKTNSSLKGMMLTPAAADETTPTSRILSEEQQTNLLIPVLKDAPLPSPKDVRSLVPDPKDKVPDINEKEVKDESALSLQIPREPPGSKSHSIKTADKIVPIKKQDTSTTSRTSSLTSTCESTDDGKSEDRPAFKGKEVNEANKKRHFLGMRFGSKQKNKLPAGA